MDRLIALLICMFWAASAAAQGWVGSRHDDGHFVYGIVSNGLGVDLMCIGPSQGGLTAFQAGAHETAPTGRDMWRMAFSVDRIPLSAGLSRQDVILWLDGTGYRLPPVQFNEMGGMWEVLIPAGDAIFPVLAAATTLVLQPGAQQSWQFDMAGIRDALSTGRAACDAAWQTAFAPAPVDLMTRARQAVQRGCGSSYSAGPEAFSTGLIDADNTPDVLVWWGDIQCHADLARPFCGASHCSADVYLSTRPEPEQMLSMSAKTIPLNNGRAGIEMFARATQCGVDSLGCKMLWHWSQTGWQVQRLP